MRPLTMFWAMLAAVSVGISFWISHEVRQRERELHHDRAAIVRLRDEIHVLEAEWAWMNRSSQVADRASRLLGFVPVPPARIAQVRDLPLLAERAPADAPAASDKPGPGAAPAKKAAPGPVARRQTDGVRATEAAYVRPAGSRR